MHNNEFEKADELFDLMRAISHISARINARNQMMHEQRQDTKTHHCDSRHCTCHNHSQQNAFFDADKSFRAINLNDLIQRAIHSDEENDSNNDRPKYRQNPNINIKIDMPTTDELNKDKRQLTLKEVYAKFHKACENSRKYTLWSPEDLSHFQKKYFDTKICHPDKLPEVLIDFEDYLSENFYSYMDFWEKDEDGEPVNIDERSQQLFQDVLEKTRNVMMELVDDDEYLSNVKTTLRYDLSLRFLHVFTAMCKMLKADIASIR